MADKENKMPETAEEGCDIRVWSDSCRRDEKTTESDKYLCVSCGKIHVLNHEVHHEHFPHICGDDDDLS